MTIDAAADEALKRQQTRLGWRFAIGCAAASALLLGVAAHWPVALFGLRPQSLWRIPFVIVIPIALAYLAATALRTGRVIFGGTVIHRSLRPRAFHASVIFLVLLACFMTIAAASVIYIDVAHTNGS